MTSTDTGLKSRTIFFVSDGTGITAETLGHSLLTQFEGVRLNIIRMPFINTTDKVYECVTRIKAAAAADGARPIVFSTLIQPELNRALAEAETLCLNFFDTFIVPLENELGIRATPTVGRMHGSIDTEEYKHRIEAINYTFAHDDGITDQGLEESDVILIGVSRCGKTPTSIYLAMQFGIKAANFPLIPEDFERKKLPECLVKNRDKLYGLTISAERLNQIRSERRPNSRYAALDNCRYEVKQAELMMRHNAIHWLDSSAKSIEEISASIMQELRFQQRTY